MAAPCRNSTWTKYIVQFLHEHIEFRIPEFLSVSRLFGHEIDIPKDHDKESPFLIVELPSEDFIKKVTSRTILVKSVHEFWAESCTEHELHKTLQSLPASQVERFTGPNVSFKIMVESFNKVLSAKEKLEKIESLLANAVSFQGPVNLSSPDEQFYYLEDYGPRYSSPPEQPRHYYFGRWISYGKRDIVKNFSLKTRNYIGNTSMDPALSIIMSNMAQCQPGGAIFDPFVGTGSLLVSAAFHGAFVTGTDIDYNLLHGKGKASRSGQKYRSRDENVRNMLMQYGLGQHYVDILVADSALQDMWRTRELFDAIITDPPYGIREPAQKVGSTKEKIEITEEQRVDHVSSKVQWHVTDIMTNLLNMAVRLLRVHGYLVYWLPVYRPDYSEAHIPQHPCLKVVANSEQILNTRISRRLITMQKTRAIESESDLSAAYVKQDIYASESFREKYFTQLDKRPAKEENKTDSVDRKKERKELKDNRKKEKQKCEKGAKLNCDNA